MRQPCPACCFVDLGHAAAAHRVLAQHRLQYPAAASSPRRREPLVARSTSETGSSHRIGKR